MTTRPSLTLPFRPPERFLLDGDINPALAGLLRNVGFDVAEAPRDRPDVIQDDVEVLRYARGEGRIVVCHDRHSDRATRQRLYPEIAHNGGHIITIGGDSSQTHLEFLGRPGIHYADWSAWIQDNPRGGKVTLHKGGWKRVSAEEMLERYIRGLSIVNLDPTPPVAPPRQMARRTHRRSAPPGRIPLPGSPNL